MSDGIAHGTYSGYQKHKKDGTPACPACRTAASDYQRRYRASRKGQRDRERWVVRTRNQALHQLARDHPDEFAALVDRARGGVRARPYRQLGGRPAAPRLYLAGPSGAAAAPVYAGAGEAARQAGFDPLIPAVHYASVPPPEYVRVVLRLLADAEAACMLPGWGGPWSPSAGVEYHAIGALDLPWYDAEAGDGGWRIVARDGPGGCLQDAGDEEFCRAYGDAFDEDEDEDGEVSS